MGDYVRIGKILEQLKAQKGADRTSSETSDRALERKRIRTEIDNLRIEQRTSFPALNIEPLKLLIKQGASIGNIYQSNDLITIDVKWPNGEIDQVYQEEGAQDVLVDRGGRNDAVTIEVQGSSRKAKYVVTSASGERTYSSKGDLTSQTQGREHHVFEEGKRVYSEDLGTGKKYYYFEGTDRVAFIEQPDGTVLKKDIFAFEENRKFQVEFQPTEYRLRQDRRRLIARPKLRARRRLRAYRKRIRARVKEARVSGKFEEVPAVSQTPKAGQVAATAGMILVAKPQTLKTLPGILGLSESLVAAFLRPGSVFGSSSVVSSKSPVVESTAPVAKVSDDAAAVRVAAHLPVIVMSGGAVAVMVSRMDVPDRRSESGVVHGEHRDPAKPATNKVKAAVLQASYKETTGAGVPVLLSERGVVPVSFGERYVAPKRAARVLDLRISNGAGRQSSLFKGSVLQAAQGSQWIVPAALPVAKAAAPIEAKGSVRETLPQELVKRTDRGSRDSGGGSNSHARDERDDKPKQQEEKDYQA